jgi:multimeric flavodoxin WrbA
VSSVAIVYFSGYGHTAKQAEAVREGAASVENAKVKIYRISETGDLPEGAFEEIGAAHAII